MAGLGYVLNTWKSEKHVPHEQSQLHVQLEHKNGLDGMSHIHSDKKQYHHRNAMPDIRTTWAICGYGTDGSYPCRYCKNLDPLSYFSFQPV